MELGLGDKVVVVTGASVGIGLAVAQGFAAEGAHVVMAARGEERLLEAAAAVAETHGVRTLAVACDVATPDGVQRLVAQTEERFGGADILVNNAGTGSNETVMDAPDDKWQAYWELHVMAAVRLARGLVPGMRRRGGGVILHNASICAAQPLWYEPIYNVTKAALMMFSKCLATELVKDNIRVNTVNPRPGFNTRLDKNGQTTHRRLGRRLGRLPRRGRSRARAHRPVRHPGRTSRLFRVFGLGPRELLCRRGALRRRGHVEDGLRRGYGGRNSVPVLVSCAVACEPLYRFILLRRRPEADFYKLLRPARGLVVMLFSNAVSRPTTMSRSTLEKRLHRTFWLLLFVVFPLAYVPASVLERLPQTWVRFPAGEQPDAFIPKIAVFVVVWLLGASLTLASVGRRGRPLPTSPRRTLAWCAAFIAVLVASSLFTSSYSNVALPYLGDRVEGVLLTLFEAAWYSFTPLAAVLAAQRVLPLDYLLNAMVGGAVAVSSWTLAQAYGFEPLALVLPGVTVGGNLMATLGHQGHVAAYLGVALVFWTVWRVLTKVRLPDVAVTALLSAGLVASGGRAGLLAAVMTLFLFGLYTVRFAAYRKTVVGLFVVLSLVGLGVVRTSGHAQTRLGRVATAVQGDDPSVQHRLLFWRLALKAIPQSPLVGYGPYSFSSVAWRVADPQDARAIIGDFLPAGLAQDAVRRGQNSFLSGPDHAATARQGHEPLRGPQLPARPESRQRSARRFVVRFVRGRLRVAALPARYPARHGRAARADDVPRLRHVLVSHPPGRPARLEPRRARLGRPRNRCAAPKAPAGGAGGCRLRSRAGPLGSSD